MPYYRISILLKSNKVVQGIKQFDNSNIDAVTNIARTQAKKHYGDNNIVDIEAAMLSKHCTAVKLYQEKQLKATEKKRWGNDKAVEPIKSRKDSHGPISSTLGERKEKR